MHLHALTTYTYPMLTINFPGSDKLIHALDDALRQDTTTGITDSIRRSLCQLMHEGSVQLPACVFESSDTHYARRELYRSEDHGRSEDHTSELQSRGHLVCRLLLAEKNI